jgi:hypothetical protein
VNGGNSGQGVTLFTFIDCMNNMQVKQFPFKEVKTKATRKLDSRK